MSSVKRKPQGRSRANSNGKANGAGWSSLPDRELLDYRVCDLGLQLNGTVLEQRVARLHQELKMRGLCFRPHCWLSEEWFSPDGIPGIAIPFYLAHPRLIRLERKQMLEVEGGTEQWCMKILRHEAGHAIDSAFGLHRRRRWREVFGKYSKPYPESYQPKPYSRSYVRHLEPCYAQSHPAEDFAETFAVWLKPRSRWRSQYVGWPAMKKLEYVDELMEQIRGKRPTVNSRARVDPVRSIRKTLSAHYAEKCARYSIEYTDAYDPDLRKLFSDSPEHSRQQAASTFLRQMRPELRRVVAHWTGQYRYTVDQVLNEMIDRCRVLKLRLGQPEPQAKRDALVMLTVQTMKQLQSGNNRFAL